MIRQVFLNIFLILALAACSRINIQPNADGTATLTISITEAEVNAFVENINNQRDPILRDVSVALQQGAIVINGIHDRADGQSVAGNMTLTASVNNGELSVQATSLNIEGFDANDERLARFNEQLAQRLSGRARSDNANANLESLTITPDTLDVSIRVQLRQ